MHIASTFRRGALLLALVAGLGTAQAAVGSLDLSRYQVVGNYALDTLDDMGLEASAVTYARDRNSLFFVGDEGLGVVEISTTGQTLGTMAFDWSGTGSSNRDSEGLAYLGNGVLVLGEERLQDAFRFSFANGGTAVLNDSKVSISNAVVGNLGMEGISYDPRDGSFVTVKQDNPQAVLAGSLSFAAGVGGVANMAPLFDADALLGLGSLSDVQTLSPIDALAGSAAADHLLILSLDSRRLVEVDRSGTILSSLDISGLTEQAIEGVTVDHLGNIYLVAEDSGMPNSLLFVLAAPVPEPGTWAMLLAGLAGIATVTRRRARRD